LANENFPCHTGGGAIVLDGNGQSTFWNTQIGWVFLSKDIRSPWPENPSSGAGKTITGCGRKCTAAVSGIAAVRREVQRFLYVRSGAR